MKLAACLFILFVQEHLVCGQQSILGTPVQEFYFDMQSILVGGPSESTANGESSTPPLDRKALFCQLVAASDQTGAATELLEQPSVVDAIWSVGSLETLWSSAARGALQMVDEMTVYSGDMSISTPQEQEAADQLPSLPGARAVGVSADPPPRTRRQIRGLSGSVAEMPTEEGGNALDPAMSQEIWTSADLAMFPQNVELGRWSAKFKVWAVERRFQHEFFSVWRGPFRIVVLLCTSVFTMVVIFYFGVVVPRDYRYVSVLFGDRRVLGTTYVARLAHGARAPP